MNATTGTKSEFSDEKRLPKISKTRGRYKLAFYTVGCTEKKSRHNSRIHIRRRIAKQTNDASTYVDEIELINNEKFLTGEKIINARKTITKSMSEEINRVVDLDCVKVDHELLTPFYFKNKKTNNSLQLSNTDSYKPCHKNKSCSSDDISSRKNISNNYNMYEAQNTEDIKMLTFRENIKSCFKNSLLMLIYSEKQDTIIENIKMSAQKLQIKHKIFQKLERNSLSDNAADFIIVDMRDNIYEFSEIQEIFKSLFVRNKKIFFIALVKQMDFEKNEICFKNMNYIGFNRFLVENCNFFTSFNELAIYKSELQTHSERQTYFSLLYETLHYCSDIVLVIDNEYKICFCNTSIKKHLQFDVNELIGENIKKKILNCPMGAFYLEDSLSRGLPWQGSLQIKNQNQQTISTLCNASPLFFNGTSFSHAVIVLQVTDNYRDKLLSLTTCQSECVTTYISQVTVLISEALKLCENGSKIDTILRKSLILLQNVNPIRSTPILKNIVEPVASELIGALLDIKTSSSATDTNTKINKKSIKEVKRTKDEFNYLSWNFDILSEESRSTNILVTIGEELFNHYDVKQTLKCDDSIIRNWLIVMEKNYHSDVYYHNATHAADVTQACAVFMSNPRLKPFLDPLTEAACLIAAVAHDLDHRGKSTAFLCNSKHPWSVLYNDITVLENHHVSYMFQLTLSDERINIFKNLDDDQYKAIRFNIIDLILSTDMTKHFEILTKFANEFSAILYSSDVYNALYTPDKVILVHRMIIKCADVSNQTRNFKMALEWCKRITEEYCLQTDEEKILGLPIVMPMFDRESCSVPKAQIGFIEYIINDLFETWNAFIDMPELLRNMRKNYKQWKRLDELGYATLDSLYNILNTLL